MDYFPLDTDFFGDIKIKRLLDSYGAKGVAAYLYVLCAAYRENGYFAECNENLVYGIAHELQIKENAVTGIIRHCARLGLFDQSCLAADGVLTSRGLQRRYMQVCRQRKVKAGITKYALADIASDCGASGGRRVIVEETAVNAEETENGFPEQTGFSPPIIGVPPEEKAVSTEEIPLKGKEIKGKEDVEGKKETGVPPPPTDFSVLPSFQQEIPVDTLVEEFKGETVFREYCQMQNRLTDSELDGYLEKFRLFLHATDEHSKRRKDCKTHFLNWLRVQLQQDRRQDPVTVPPGTDAARQPEGRHIARLRQLYPENNFYAETLYRNYIREHGLTPDEALDHFERAYRNGLTYGKVIYRVQVEHSLLFKN